MWDDSKLKQKQDAFKTRLLEAFGQAIAGDAAENAPVDTGALKNSISHKATGDTVAVGSPLNYALKQELYNHRASGFLIGALDNVVSQAKSIIKAQSYDS